MYYHASPAAGIRTLEPRISNHDVPLIYFSAKRENTLVYLSNAVEKYCRETGFAHSGRWTKWGPYGFEKDGRFRLEEYYPGALEDTYKGVSGYIYSAKHIADSGFQLQIPDAAAAGEPVEVTGCEFVPDAYEAILAAERAGLIAVRRFEDSGEAQLEWIARTVRKEYENAAGQPEYRHFLEGKFRLGK